MRYLLLLLTFYFVILSLLTHNQAGLVVGDVAEYLNNPVRILNGQLPYRDFWLLFPPGEVYFPALIYKIFGINVNAVLIVNVFIQFTIALLGFLILKLFTRINLYAFIGALLIYFFAINNLYILLILLAAYALLISQKNNQNYLTSLSGIFLGFAFWFRFYEIAAVSFTFLVTLYIFKEYKKAVVFSLSNLLPILLLLFVFRSIFHPMLNQVLFSSLTHGTNWYLPYFIELKINLGFAFTNLKSLIETPTFIGLYLLPLSVFCLSLYHLLVYKKHPRYLSFTLCLLTLWAICLFPRALRRGAIADLAHSLLPIFLLSGIFQSLPAPKLIKQLFSFTLIFSLSFTLVFSYKNIRFLNRERFLIKAPNGVLQTTDLNEFVRDQFYLNLILEAPEKTPLFYTFWELPPLYALTSRHNPTYYDSLIDLLAVPDQEKEKRLCLILKQTDPFIIHDPNGGIVDVNRYLYSFQENTPILNDCLANN